jgi:hypothetical protein
VQAGRLCTPKIVLAVGLRRPALQAGGCTRQQGELMNYRNQTSAAIRRAAVLFLGSLRFRDKLAWPAGRPISILSTMISTNSLLFAAQACLFP